MNADGYPDAMSTAETPTNAAQDSPSLWQRSLWPLLLLVALLLLAFILTVEHWLRLEGYMADVVGALGVGLAGSAIFTKAGNLRDRRREAEAAAGGSGS